MRSHLPKCFDVWIVENFLIAGHKFYIAAVGDRNNNTIGWVFVEVAGATRTTYITSRSIYTLHPKVQVGVGWQR
jgi:hypothetical protein